MSSARILIVESDEPAAPPLEELLRGLGYTVCSTVSSAAQAAEAAAVGCFDLAVIDLGAAGGSRGIEAAERLGRLGVPLVCLTDGVEVERLCLIEAPTLYGGVVKPVDARQLHLSIQTVLSLHGRITRYRARERDLQRVADELWDLRQREGQKVCIESATGGVAVGR